MRLKVLVGLFGALTVLGAPRFEQVPLQVSPEAELAAPKLVPVFVAKPLCVMSRCPDAHAAEQLMDRVFGSQSSQGVVRDLIDPDLLFIGSLNEAASPYGVECKHGASECRGNVQQLCMMDNYGWKTWWPFVQCLRWSGSRIGDDSLARQCATLSKVNWNDDLQDCVDGPRGAELLQASVKEADRRDIHTSASMLINHKLVCVRDNGLWRNCSQGHEVSDFTSQIARAYDALN